MILAFLKERGNSSVIIFRFNVHRLIAQWTFHGILHPNHSVSFEFSSCPYINDSHPPNQGKRDSWTLMLGPSHL
jgi:hypothetical protein